MLFMVIERFRAGMAKEVYRRLQERGRMMPDGVRLIESWVDLEFQRCFQLMEADEEEMLAPWTRNWVDLVDFEIVPVRSSEQAAAAMARELQRG